MYRSRSWALTAITGFGIALLLGRIDGPFARVAAQVGVALTFAFFPYCLLRAAQLLLDSRVQSYSGPDSIIGEGSIYSNPPMKVPAAQARWKP